MSALSALSSLSALEEAACQPGQIRITGGRGNGAAGTGYYAFSIRNYSGVACRVGGYFGVSVYSLAGHLISSTAARQLRSFDGRTVRAATLEPGGVASFFVSVSETPAGVVACPVIGAFHLIPPNTTAEVQIDVQGGAHPPDCGRPEVYPTELGAPQP